MHTLCLSLQDMKPVTWNKYNDELASLFFITCDTNRRGGQTLYPLLSSCAFLSQKYTQLFYQLFWLTQWNIIPFAKLKVTSPVIFLYPNTHTTTSPSQYKTSFQHCLPVIMPQSSFCPSLLVFSMLNFFPVLVIFQVWIQLVWGRRARLLVRAAPGGSETIGWS